ncbi:hypothetical protein U1Q18_002313 [Sarracenia purpurea var. burkii]
MGMKKRRNVAGKGTAVATKAKEKREAAEAAEAAAAATEEDVAKVAEKSREGAVAEERPRWLWSAADEQMSWGSFWCPSWDIEYLGEAYNALYSDVVWEDDVWDLKGIKEVPNP